MDLNCDGNKMYKATKIWNECIYLFKNGMPVKRHRYRVRVFPDTFTGEEATDWLHGTLKMNSYFGQDISKTQVTQLLNKFFKSGVFESVKPMKNFKGGKQLYRFKMIQPSPADSHFRDPNAMLPGTSDYLKANTQPFGGSFIEENYFTDSEEINRVDYHSYNNCNMRSDVSANMSWNDESFKSFMNEIKKDVRERQSVVKVMNESNGVRVGINKENVSPTPGLCFSDNDHHSDFIQSRRDLPQTFAKRQSKDKHSAEYFMKMVLGRINNVIGRHMNLNAIVPFDYINPDWVVCNINMNVCEKYADRINEKTNLPAWVIDAVICLGFPDGKTLEEEKYPGYFGDVYSVLYESIIASCEKQKQLIPCEMNDLIINSFLFLRNLNRSISDSEHIFNDRSSVGKQNKMVDFCPYYETTFTSDRPVTRIIHRKPVNTKHISPLSASVITHRSMSDLQISCPPIVPNKSISVSSLNYNYHKQNCISNYRVGQSGESVVKIKDDVIDNHFKTSIKNSGCHRRYMSCENLTDFTRLKFDSRKVDARSEVGENENNCYINYGMSESFDSDGDGVSKDYCDVNHHQDTLLNYDDAIKFIDTLVKHSKMHKNSFPGENGTCSSGNESSNPDCEQVNKKWVPYVEHLGLTLFRNEMLLLPPENREKLNIVLFLIEHLIKNDYVSDLKKKREMLAKLSICISREAKMSCCDEDSRATATRGAVIFLAEHRQAILTTFADDYYHPSDNSSRYTHRVDNVSADPSDYENLPQTSINWKSYSSNNKSATLPNLKSLRI